MVNEKISVSTQIGKLIDSLMKQLGSDKIKQMIGKFIRKKYNDGLEDAGKFFNQNFSQNTEDLNFLLSYVKGQVGNVTDSINKDLRRILDTGIAEGANTESIKLRVKEEFNSQKHINRYKMVIRTEGLRAENTASLSAAKELEFEVKKYLDVVQDDRTSDVCHKEHEEYGSKDLAINLDKDFVVKVNNKTIRAQAPPFHPNCRSVIRYVEVDDDDRS